MNAKQAIGLLTLPVKLVKDTPQGTWLTASGKSANTSDGEVPIGISQTDGKQGEMVGVTVIGTASMALKDVATGAVKQGDYVVFDDAMMVVRANQYAQYAGKVLGVVLYDAHQNSHAEVLLR